MTRTNIDLDDELVAEAMRKYNLRTKREAVELALRRLVGPRLTPSFLAGLRGIGWGNWSGPEDRLRRAQAAEGVQGRPSVSITRASKKCRPCLAAVDR